MLPQSEAVQINFTIRKKPEEIPRASVTETLEKIVLEPTEKDIIATFAK